MPEFQIVSEFKPTGDQPDAIAKAVAGIDEGLTHQTLMGVTGSGKTFTMANIIEKAQRPTLVIAHNKTLAAQLATEFKEFFPNNAVEYFVSYYDYYQPEAYVPRTDTYIEKDADINEELDKLRHAATRRAADSAGYAHRGVRVVHIRSGFTGGVPEFRGVCPQGRDANRRLLIRQLVDMQYERNDMDFARGNFRVRGDTMEILPAYEELGIRIEFWGDEVDRIMVVNPLTGELLGERDDIEIYPAKHFVTSQEKMNLAIQDIEVELEECVRQLKEEGKLLEAERLGSRTRYDIEMMQEDGVLRGRGELLAAPGAAGGGQHAIHADGLLPGGLPAVRGRVAHDAAADTRDVPRGQVAQGNAGGVRLSPAVRAGQPPPELRGVRRACEPGGVCLRDARPV